MRDKCVVDKTIIIFGYRVSTACVRSREAHVALATSRSPGPSSAAFLFSFSFRSSLFRYRFLPFAVSGTRRTWVVPQPSWTVSDSAAFSTSFFDFRHVIFQPRLFASISDVFSSLVFCFIAFPSSVLLLNHSEKAYAARPLPPVQRGL